jgi:hypothetical protein
VTLGWLAFLLAVAWMAFVVGTTYRLHLWERARMWCDGVTPSPPAFFVAVIIWCVIVQAAWLPIVLLAIAAD